MDDGFGTTLKNIFRSRAAIEQELREKELARKREVERLQRLKEIQSGNTRVQTATQQQNAQAQQQQQQNGGGGGGGVSSASARVAAPAGAAPPTTRQPQPNQQARSAHRAQFDILLCLQQTQVSLGRLRALSPTDINAFPLLNECKRQVQQLVDAVASMSPADQEVWQFQLQELQEEGQRLMERILNTADAHRPTAAAASAGGHRAAAGSQRSPTASTGGAVNLPGRPQLQHPQAYLQQQGGRGAGPNPQQQQQQRQQQEQQQQLAQQQQERLRRQQQEQLEQQRQQQQERLRQQQQQQAQQQQQEAGGTSGAAKAAAAAPSAATGVAADPPASAADLEAQERDKAIERQRRIADRRYYKAGANGSAVRPKTASLQQLQQQAAEQRMQRDRLASQEEPRRHSSNGPLVAVSSNGEADMFSGLSIISDPESELVATAAVPPPAASHQLRGPSSITLAGHSAGRLGDMISLGSGSAGHPASSSSAVAAGGRLAVAGLTSPPPTSSAVVAAEDELERLRRRQMDRDRSTTSATSPNTAISAFKVSTNPMFAGATLNPTFSDDISDGGDAIGGGLSTQATGDFGLPSSTRGSVANGGSMSHQPSTSSLPQASSSSLKRKKTQTLKLGYGAQEDELSPPVPIHPRGTVGATATPSTSQQHTASAAKAAPEPVRPPAAAAVAGGTGRTTVELSNLTRQQLEQHQKQLERQELKEELARRARRQQQQQLQQRQEEAERQQQRRAEEEEAASAAAAAAQQQQQQRQVQIEEQVRQQQELQRAKMLEEAAALQAARLQKQKQEMLSKQQQQQQQYLQHNRSSRSSISSLAGGGVPSASAKAPLGTTAAAAATAVSTATSSTGPRLMAVPSTSPSIPQTTSHSSQRPSAASSSSRPSVVSHAASPSPSLPAAAAGAVAAGAVSAGAVAKAAARLRSSPAPSTPAKAAAVTVAKPASSSTQVTPPPSKSAQHPVVSPPVPPALSAPAQADDLFDDLTIEEEQQHSSAINHLKTAAGPMRSAVAPRPALNLIASSSSSSTPAAGASAPAAVAAAKQHTPAVSAPAQSTAVDDLWELDSQPAAPPVTTAVPPAAVAAAPRAVPPPYSSPTAATDSAHGGDLLDFSSPGPSQTLPASVPASAPHTTTHVTASQLHPGGAATTGAGDDVLDAQEPSMLGDDVALTWRPQTPPLSDRIEDLEAYLSGLMGTVEERQAAAVKRTQALIEALAAAVALSQRQEGQAVTQRRDIRRALTSAAQEVADLEQQQSDAVQVEDFEAAAEIDVRQGELAAQRAVLAAHIGQLDQYVVGLGEHRLQLAKKQADAWNTCSQYLLALRSAQQEQAALLARQAEEEACSTQERLAAADEQIAEEQQALAEQQAALAEAQGRVDLQMAAATAPANQSVLKLEAEKHDLEAQIAALRARLLELERCLASNQQHREAAEAEMAAVRLSFAEELEKLAEEQQYVEDCAADLQAKVARVEEVREDSARRAASVAEEQALLMAQSTALQLKALELSANAAATCERIAAEQEQERRAEELLGAANAAQERLDDLNRCLSGAKADLAETSSRRTALASDLGAVRAQLQEAQARLPELEGQKRAAAASKNFKEAARVAAEAKATAAHIESLSAVVSGKAQQLAALQVDEQAQADDVQALQGMLPDIQRQAAVSRLAYLHFDMDRRQLQRDAAVEHERFEEAEDLEADLSAAREEFDTLSAAWGLPAEPEASAAHAAASHVTHESDLAAAARSQCEGDDDQHIEDGDGYDGAGDDNYDGYGEEDREEDGQRHGGSDGGLARQLRGGGFYGGGASTVEPDPSASGRLTIFDIYDTQHSQSGGDADADSDADMEGGGETARHEPGRAGGTGGVGGEEQYENDDVERYDGEGEDERCSDERYGEQRDTERGNDGGLHQGGADVGPDGYGSDGRHVAEEEEVEGELEGHGALGHESSWVQERGMRDEQDRLEEEEGEERDGEGASAVAAERSVQAGQAHDEEEGPGGGHSGRCSGSDERRASQAGSQRSSARGSHGGAPSRGYNRTTG